MYCPTCKEGYALKKRLRSLKKMFAVAAYYAKEKGYSSISGVALAQKGKFPFPQMMERIRHGKETTVSTMTGEEVSLKTSEYYLKNSNEDYLPDIFTLELDVWFAKGQTTANRLWIFSRLKKIQKFFSLTKKSLNACAACTHYNDN